MPTASPPRSEGVTPERPEAGAAGVIEVPDRRCGRCRRMFEGDPSLPVGLQQDWWVCASCHVVLLPDRPNR